MKLKSKIIVILYMIVLACLSLQPASAGAQTSAWQQILHNACHVPAYAVLAFLMLRTFVIKNKRAYQIVFFVSFSYGVLMEIGQSFSPGRTFSVGDMCLNALGISIVLFLNGQRILKNEQ